LDLAVVSKSLGCADNARNLHRESALLKASHEAEPRNPRDANPFKQRSRPRNKYCIFYCYLKAISRAIANDFVGAWEHVAVTHIKAVLPESVKELWHELRTSYWPAKQEPALEGAGWGVEEAEQDNKTNASKPMQFHLAPTTIY